MKWHQALLKTCHWFWWFFAQSPFDPSFSIFLTWLYINTSVPLHTAVSSPYIHITIISYNYVIVISYRLITISSQKPLWSPGDHPPPSPPASSCQRAVSVRHRAGLNWIFDFSCSNIGFLIKYWNFVDQILYFLSDPGIPGVRSMGPGVWNWLTDVFETLLSWLCLMKIPTQY